MTIILQKNKAKKVSVSFQVKELFFMCNFSYILFDLSWFLVNLHAYLKRTIVMLIIIVF